MKTWEFIGAKIYLYDKSVNVHDYISTFMQHVQGMMRKWETVQHWLWKHLSFLWLKDSWWHIHQWKQSPKSPSTYCTVFNYTSYTSLKLNPALICSSCVIIITKQHIKEPLIEETWVCDENESITSTSMSDCRMCLIQQAQVWKFKRTNRRSMLSVGGWLSSPLTRTPRDKAAFKLPGGLSLNFCVCPPTYSS